MGLGLGLTLALTCQMVSTPERGSSSTVKLLVSCCAKRCSFQLIQRKRYSPHLVRVRVRVRVRDRVRVRARVRG